MAQSVRPLRAGRYSKKPGPESTRLARNLQAREQRGCISATTGTETVPGGAGPRPDHPISLCLNRLIAAPPRSMREAVAYFSYLGCRNHSDFENLDEQGKRLRFVPIFSTDSRTILRYVSPADCYVGDQHSFAQLFD